MIPAMTAEEIQSSCSLPSAFAYLGCHFSATVPELTGLPKALPPGCGIILDDGSPIPKADPAPVIDQFLKLNPAYILLDFQHPPTDHSFQLAAALDRSGFCVPMPPAYGKDLNCPLFLPPIPPHILAEEYLNPWKNREIWLELALDAVQIDITPQGSQVSYFPHALPPDKSHKDSMLHCHYKITQGKDVLSFYCYRTKEDVSALVHTSLPAHVTQIIGLYQEFGA